MELEGFKWFWYMNWKDYKYENTQNKGESRWGMVVIKDYAKKRKEK